MTAGFGFAIVPSVIASFHTKLHQWSVICSVGIAALYVLGLIVAGFLVPEAAVVSLLIALLFLAIVEATLRLRANSPRPS